MKKICSIIINYSLSIIISPAISAQLKWQNVDSLYQPLPASVHIYFTDSPIDTGKFRAYYLIADLKDQKLEFTTDTSRDRRLKPSEFYQRNDKALVVVNTTFFSFETNRSLNVVIKDGKLLAYNQHTIPGRGKDTLTYRHPFGSAIGISKKREADVGWLFTDSIMKNPMASQIPWHPLRDSLMQITFDRVNDSTTIYPEPHHTSASQSLFTKWKMQTAMGGGPVLLQSGEIKITNNEELKFAGKAINDKHPRTAMGYTKDGKLIILVIEGRNKNAGGATLTQEAQIFKDLGCWEALNLDGGGSSCMLVNGKETIRVSDAAGQRQVPAVFMIRKM
ncbi:MAG: phosphodiester glycosidase family protein [Chitinophagaceae bacterium]